MRNFRCIECKMEILNSDRCCTKCGAIGVEHKLLSVMRGNDNQAQYLESLIADGFKIINKKRIVLRSDEMNFSGIEYELQKPDLN